MSRGSVAIMTDGSQILHAISGAEGGAEGDEGADGAPGAAGADDSPLGDEFVELSLYEPHKRYQNSFSIFQRRPAGWGGEPVHTNYP